MSDDWDFYFCQVESNPASIFIDLGVRNEAPIAGLTELVWVRLYMCQPLSNGLSSNEEFARLREIEDALTAAISGRDQEVLYVGRNTSDGHRDYYFYASEGRLAEGILSAVMVRFPEYEFEIGSRPEPDWTAYFDFLYPPARDLQVIWNGRVLRSLESQGDNHELERPVCHWIYFSSSQDRASYFSAVSEKGYRLLSQHDDAEGERSFSLSIESIHPLDDRTINTVVLELFDLASECNGQYDGWEAPVRKA